MGCSPSKGKLFTKQDGLEPQNTLLTEPTHGRGDSRPVDEVNACLGTDKKEIELPLPTEEHPAKDTERSQLTSNTADKITEGSKGSEENVVSKEIHKKVIEFVQSDKIKKIEKRKKNKNKRKFTEKLRKSSISQTKVELPPFMVRAHQAAYAYLNPNISKYETLLGLLDQAAQTQLSLQPVMSALVLRFEEINQALEEMAEEGELVLKEHGEYMALPSGMMGPVVMPAKSIIDKCTLSDAPPDLLQQMLQHSTQKMKLVGGSVQTLGDTTLEEAVEYFSSLSKVLVEKLRAKQLAERRLAVVLARVEGAAMKTANPEDSSLHSEDSGIGGENESLAGSERHRRHRGSAGSGSCSSSVNIRNLPSLVDHNEDDEEDEEEEEDEDEDDDEDDDEEYEDDDGDRPGRKRSNSAPPDPSQPFLSHVSHKQDQQPAIKRPLTAITTTKTEHLSSARCANIAMELQRSQRDLDLRIRRMAEIRANRASVGPHYNLYRAGLRRHSISGSHRGPLRTNQSSGGLPMLAPQPPRRPSVRRLINTFSQGVDGRPGQSLANIPPHIRRPRKSGVLLLSETENSNEGGLVINGSNNNNNSWPDGRDELDVDNLPPPPPEVLMDNSFRSTEGTPGHEEGSQEHPAQSLQMINQRNGVSQRLRASVQNVELLPNRASVRPKSMIVSSAHPVKEAQEADQQQGADMDPDMEKNDCLYQQARKIIHLRNAAESLDKKTNAQLNDQRVQRCESTDFCEGEVPSCNLPVIAPPVSRVRLPPSCPSVPQRFPSPPVFRPQSTSSRPSSPRTVVRATDNNTEEIVPLVSFRDARSVFCRNEAHTSSGRSWGEGSRGRLSTRGADGSVRRTQSERRPTNTSNPQFSKDCNSGSTQAKESELLSSSHRLGSPLRTRDNIQSDPSAAV